jgi:hypothetical protein
VRAPSLARLQAISFAVVADLFAIVFAISGAGCAESAHAPKTPSPDSPPGALAPPPRVVRIDPMSAGGASKPAGLVALEEELHRGMRELGGKGKPPPYYIAYATRASSTPTSASAATSSTRPTPSARTTSTSRP